MKINTSANQSYYDLSQLQQLKVESKINEDDALMQTAKQFESLLLQMVLKSMRDANEALVGEESMLSSDSMGFYQDMHDKQLSMNLGQGKGLGLAELMVQQLKGLDKN